DPSIKLSFCGQTMCTWPAQALPYPLAVECVPGTGQTTGTLVVYEASTGAASFASVTCTSTAAGPVLAVSPKSLDFGTLPVGQAYAQMITIANTGFSKLDNVVVDFGATANAMHWQASGCTAASPCRISAGSSVDVSITFAPTTHGNKDIVATVTSSNGG